MESLVKNNELENFYKDKTVLLTGATGFKGSWMALWLYEMGANVIDYSLAPLTDEDHFNLLNLENKITHIQGDILDLNKLTDVFNKYNPEIVFHLAAQALVRLSYDNPKLTFDTNVAGSVNVLEAIRASDSVRSFVYVTSDKAYKNKEWTWGYRENDELGGHDPYSASKAAAEIVFSSYNDSFFSKKADIGVGTVRAGNVIGGGDWALDRIIPDCIRSLRANKPIVIRNPHATRPWQHVLEPLSGYLLLGMKLYQDPDNYSGAWNFGPNIKSIKTVKELSEKVISVFGKGQLDLQYDKNANHEASILHLNCDKSNTKLSWYPTWDFDATIERTVNWYIGHLNGDDPKDLTMLDINEFLKEKKMIEGVIVKEMKRIPDDRGKILHIMKSSDSEYDKFGEVYCSTVYPGIVKGWHLHTEMTLNYVVLKGKIKFVLYDSRENSSTYGETQVIYIGDDNYVRVTVPPFVWNGFMGVGLEESFIINFTDIPHDPNEIKRMDPHNNDIIDYDWSIKDR